jgi:serine/threonine protein kinase
MALFRRTGAGDDEGDVVRAEHSPAFLAFAASGMHPQLETWRRTSITPADAASGTVELWSDVRTLRGTPFAYPHLVAAYRSDGALVGLIAAELMPGVHSDVYLGVFAQGSHHNLGADQGLLDRNYFVARALEIARGMLTPAPPPPPPPPAPPPPPPRWELVTPSGSYQLGEQIGLGGFADVYRALAPNGREVVVKVASPRGGSRGGTRGFGCFPAAGYQAVTGGAVHHTFSPAELTELFEDEARVLAAARGRRLPRLLDRGRIGPLPALVLDLLPAPWTPPVADPHGYAALLDALQDLASTGVGHHGDLKPENVFLNHAEWITFIDPGYHGDRTDVWTSTPEFDPFVLRGSVAKDVVAVAVIAFQAYAGRPPVVDEDGRYPELASVSPAPRGVSTWVDALLNPPGTTDRGWHGPSWAHDYAAAAAELRTALAQPIVESGALAVMSDRPRTSSQLSVELPPGWYIKESWTLLAPNGQANVIVSSEPLDPSIDVTRYATIQGDLLRREFPGYVEHGFQPFAFASGQQGYRRDFEWTPPDGVCVRQVQLYYAGGGRGFTATATTPASFAPGLMGLFNTTLESIRIDE